MLDSRFNSLTAVLPIPESLVCMRARSIAEAIEIGVTMTASPEITDLWVAVIDGDFFDKNDDDRVSCYYVRSLITGKGFIVYA